MPVVFSLNTSSEVFVGLDCEWNRRDGWVNISIILQLYFPNQKVTVMHLSKLNVFLPATFPPSMKNLIEIENLLFVGEIFQ